MKILLTAVFLVFAFVNSGHAQTSGNALVPVVGSCTQSFGSAWCDCDFTTLGGGNVHGQIDCSVLSCYHMKGYWQNDNCAYPAETVTCVLNHPAYSGSCKQPVEFQSAEKTAQDACKEVETCLNDTTCSKTYCNATELRQNWLLIGIE